MAQNSVYIPQPVQSLGLTDASTGQAYENLYNAVRFGGDPYTQGKNDATAQRDFAAAGGGPASTAALGKIAAVAAKQKRTNQLQGVAQHAEMTQPAGRLKMAQDFKNWQLKLQQDRAKEAGKIALFGSLLGMGGGIAQSAAGDVGQQRATTAAYGSPYGAGTGEDQL